MIAGFQAKSLAMWAADAPTGDHARTFFVDHLHVEPACHGKGVAPGLLNALADELQCTWPIALN